ncbi:MAG: ArsR family transcriptional regulator [Chloroflexi bacterium]|nr:ArsR family transcriptional regulator [Chloroflexota bacterium]
MASWGFLTNHAHALIQVARDPRSTVREIALETGITERAAHAVLKDLRQAGIVSTRREGRLDIKQVDVAALVRHRPWGASDMEIPEQLIQATLRGLAAVVRDDGGTIAQQPPCTDSAAHEETDTVITRRWGFLTTHALILIYVTQHPHSTVREIALAVGVTERAAHSTLQDLREARIIECERSGRRNSYTVNFLHLSGFRREGTAAGLVPDSFVSSIVDALLPLQAPEYAMLEDEAHPVN